MDFPRISNRHTRYLQDGWSSTPLLRPQTHGTRARCADAVDVQNLAVLQRIANSPVTRRLHQHEKGKKRWQKLREKTKKYQSRF